MDEEPISVWDACYNLKSLYNERQRKRDDLERIEGEIITYEKVLYPALKEHAAIEQNGVIFVIDNDKPRILEVVSSISVKAPGRGVQGIIDDVRAADLRPASAKEA